jgi:hypothetical protein
MDHVVHEAVPGSTGHCICIVVHSACSLFDISNTGFSDLSMFELDIPLSNTGFIEAEILVPTCQGQVMRGRED